MIMKPTILLLTVLSIFLNKQLFGQQKGLALISIQTSAICEMCKDAIEYELTFTKGVKNANLDLETKKVTVEYNPKKINASQLRETISLIGYHADNIKRDSIGYQKLPFCCRDDSHHGKHKKHG